MTISDPLDGHAADQFESDGTVTIGPLPRGTTMIVVDVPPFAQTRLPDVVVTGTEPLLDAGGVITIQPGAVPQAYIVDETARRFPHMRCGSRTRLPNRRWSSAPPERIRRAVPSSIAWRPAAIACGRRRRNGVGISCSRAIDFHEDDKLDEKALKALIRAAAALNKS